jgi:hypothetical protein
MIVILNQDEVAELFTQDPAQKSKGGFQGLLVGLQENYTANQGKLFVDPVTATKIRKYAFGYKNGGWQRRLLKIFGRTMGPELRKTA